MRSKKIKHIPQPDPKKVLKRALKLPNKPKDWFGLTCLVAAIALIYWLTPSR